MLGGLLAGLGPAAPVMVAVLLRRKPPKAATPDASPSMLPPTPIVGSFTGPADPPK